MGIFALKSLTALEKSGAVGLCSLRATLASLSDMTYALWFARVPLLPDPSPFTAPGWPLSALERKTLSRDAF